MTEQRTFHNFADAPLYIGYHGENLVTGVDIDLAGVLPDGWGAGLLLRRPGEGREAEYEAVSALEGSTLRVTFEAYDTMAEGRGEATVELRGTNGEKKKSDTALTVISHALDLSGVPPEPPELYRTAAQQDIIDAGKLSKAAQAEKTDAMTQPVGVDANGKLWVPPGGGGGGTGDHRDLTNRDAANQHPISAVSGLARALAELEAAITDEAGIRSDRDMMHDLQISALDINKQDDIDDLETIRSGAELGATALQEVPATYRTAAQQDVIDAAKIEDAPNDGQQYARKNKAWAVVQGGGAVIDDTAGDGDTDKAWSADKLTSELGGKADKTETVTTCNVYELGAGRGSNDTAIIQNALDNYDDVFFPSTADGYKISQPLIVTRSGQHIHGQSRKARFDTAQDSRSHSVIRPHGSFVGDALLKIDSTCQHVCIEHMSFQTQGSYSGGDFDGINLNYNHQSGAAVKGYHTLRDVMVYQAQGNGIVCPGYSWSNTLINVVVKGCTKNGIVYDGTDAAFTNVFVAENRYSGVVLGVTDGGSSNVFSGCKFFCNSKIAKEENPTDDIDISELSGLVINPIAVHNRFSGLQVQQNCCNGIRILTDSVGRSGHQVFSDLVVDGNGWDNPTTGLVGIEVQSDNNIFSGCVIIPHWLDGCVEYGLKVTGEHNDINVNINEAHADGSYETARYQDFDELFTFTPIHPDSDLANNRIVINADDGKQSKITASGVLQGDGSGGVTAKTVDSTPTSGSQNLVTSGGVFSAVSGKADKPTIKTTMDSVAAVNTQYFLGTQSAVNIVLPSNAEVGQQISAVWYNGATAATLSVTGNVLTVDYTPSANSRSEINALWDGTYWAVVANEQAVTA